MSPGKAFGAYSGCLAPFYLWKPMAIGAGQRTEKGNGRTDKEVETHGLCRNILEAWAWGGNSVTPE